MTHEMDAVMCEMPAVVGFSFIWSTSTAISWVSMDLIYRRLSRVAKRHVKSFGRYPYITAGPTSPTPAF